MNFPANYIYLFQRPFSSSWFKEYARESFWRRQWQPTPVPLPGKSHGWRSLVGCSPWGHEKSDTYWANSLHFSLSCIGEGNGNPLQCSCLENPRDGGAWLAAICGVAQSQTRLKRLSSSSRVFFLLSGSCLYFRHPWVVRERIVMTSVQFSSPVVSDFLWHHGLQHSWLPCPSPTPGAYSDSCPSSQWCHPSISSSVGPLSSRLQSFPAAAAAAKLLQSCPTLCDPIDGSPPGFAIPGTLQARVLQWVAISFFSAWRWKEDTQRPEGSSNIFWVSR